MCVIAIKEKGADFPSMQRVETMCSNNPHGFALVYNPGDGKGSRVYRTMDEEKFLQHYRFVSSKYNKDTTSLYLHARIATHGSLRKENCHGFLDHNTRLCFAHNGILSSIKNRDDMTDSETFFRDYFIPAFRHGGWKEAGQVIDNVIGYSKFVFMNNKGELRHFGHYIKDRQDGVLYSNSSYLSWEEKFSLR